MTRTQTIIVAVFVLVIASAHCALIYHIGWMAGFRDGVAAYERGASQ